MALTTRVNPVPKLVEKDGKKQRILYIEDEDSNWDVTKLSLRGRYYLTRASTSEEAFRLLSAEKFDLILMDIQLSGSSLNGIEITQILRGLMNQAKIPNFAQAADCQGARIIFVTAYSARYNKDELLRAGGDDLITKPVDFTRLSLAISRLLVREAFDNQPQVKKFLTENNFEEKRSHMRVPLQLNCAVRSKDASYHAYLWDLSIGGARIVFDPGPVPASLSKGSLCTIQFTTAWGIIESDISVVWNDGDKPNEIGVSFVGMSEDCTGILIRWLGSQTDEE